MPAWAPLGKAPLPLDDGHSRSGRYRYGDLTIAVPRGNPGLLADGERLLALRDVFEGGGAQLDWSAGAPTPSWEGVTVSGSPPRVTGLNLTERGLTGEIWGWLGDLTELTELRLDGNTLKGRIPSKLLLLKNLTVLYFGGNELEGCIPPPLRAVPNNDLDSLDLPDCLDPDLGLISYGTVPQHPVFGAGTHRVVLKSETPVHIVVDVPTGQSVRFAYYPPGGDQQVDAGELGDIFEAAEIFHEFGIALRDTNDSRTWLFLENETGREVARNPYPGCVYDCGPGGSRAALVEKLAASVWLNTAIETDPDADTLQTYYRWLWP